MKKLLLIILLFVPTIKVKGYYCDYQDVAKYKRIASNINYSYEYEEINGDVKFYITLTNLNETLYLIDSNGNFYNYTSDELVVEAYSGENLKFYVYPNDTYCDDNYIYVLRIQLPTYNTYYNDPICSGIQNYHLCNKWSTHNLSYEKFSQKVSEYKKSLEKEKIVEESKTEKTFLDYFIEYLLEYYYLILIGIIIICSTIIFVKSRNNNIYN